MREAGAARARRRARSCSPRTGAGAAGRWTISTRRAIRSGRPSCATGAPIPRSPRRSARASPRIHAATRRTRRHRRRFPTDAIFHAIRLEPYLRRHRRARIRDLAPRAATRWSRRPRATKLALVHGDVSPKNILVGPDGPVFLDAECAWYGDPAFDLAFCLNHLLLKCLWMPQRRAGFLACFDALAEPISRACDWEPRPTLEARAAALLPGLLPRPRRRQVAGRIPDRRGATRSAVRRVARAAARVAAVDARRGARRPGPGAGA